MALFSCTAKPDVICTGSGHKAHALAADTCTWRNSSSGPQLWGAHVSQSLNRNTAMTGKVRTLLSRYDDLHPAISPKHVTSDSRLPAISDRLEIQLQTPDRENYIQLTPSPPANLQQSVTDIALQRQTNTVADKRCGPTQPKLVIP